MSKICFVGLDVHAETIAVAIAETNGEVRSIGVIPNRLESIRKLISKLPVPTSFGFVMKPVQRATSCTGN